MLKASLLGPRNAKDILVKPFSCEAGFCSNLG